MAFTAPSGRCGWTTTRSRNGSNNKPAPPAIRRQGQLLAGADHLPESRSTASRHLPESRSIAADHRPAARLLTVGHLSDGDLAAEGPIRPSRCPPSWS
jgi:hypothetical protein